MDEAKQVDLRVTGMTCANCVKHVETALRAVPGVAEVSVTLATSKAVITLGAPPDPKALAALIEAVVEEGYDASLWAPSPAGEAGEAGVAGEAAEAGQVGEAGHGRDSQGAESASGT